MTSVFSMVLFTISIDSTLAAAARILTSLFINPPFAVFLGNLRSIFPHYERKKFGKTHKIPSG